MGNKKNTIPFDEEFFESSITALNELAESMDASIAIVGTHSKLDATKVSRFCDDKTLMLFIVALFLDLPATAKVDLIVSLFKAVAKDYIKLKYPRERDE